jgi:hypothetical protein
MSKYPGAKHVDVVAHSMGGLIARAWMVSGPGNGNPLASAPFTPYDKQIRRLITIGTPHYGATSGFLRDTYAESKDCSTAQVDEMRFGSDFVLRLHDEWQKNPPIAPENVLLIAGTGSSTPILECDPYTVGAQGCNDGVVDISSAALPVAPNETDNGQMIRYVPYPHTTLTLKAKNVGFVWRGIIDVFDKYQLTYQLVREFLKLGTVLTQESLGYAAPFQRGVALGQEGLLLLRLRPRGPVTAPITFGPAPIVSINFTPTQSSSSFTTSLNPTASTLTVLGLSSGWPNPSRYEEASISIRVKGFSTQLTGKAIDIRMTSGRPTILDQAVIMK